MPKRDKIPDFSFDDLLGSMQQGADHAAGKITARTHQLTTRAEAFSGEEIANIRKRMNVSQAVFADLLNGKRPKFVPLRWLGWGDWRAGGQTASATSNLARRSAAMRAGVNAAACSGGIPTGKRLMTSTR